jgi:hypothetical protein
MIKVCNSVIVQEIEDPDAGEGLGHDVCDDRGRGGGIHGWLTEGNVVKLGEGVD